MIAITHLVVLSAAKDLRIQQRAVAMPGPSRAAPAQDDRRGRLAQLALVRYPSNLRAPAWMEMHEGRPQAIRKSSKAPLFQSLGYIISSFGAFWPVVAQEIARPDSPLEQDGQRLLVGDLGALLELGQGATADRVLDLEERVVGQAQHARDVTGGDDERLGAQHHRPLAQLFEGDSVVQTARRAGPSIAEASDQEVDLLGDLRQRGGGCGRTGIAL